MFEVIVIGAGDWLLVMLDIYVADLYPRLVWSCCGQDVGLRVYAPSRVPLTRKLEILAISRRNRLPKSSSLMGTQRSVAPGAKTASIHISLRRLNMDFSNIRIFPWMIKELEKTV